MLSCLNLQCERGGRALFSGVGFTLLPGCLLLIRGSNGEGKSSFLKMIAGIIHVTHGKLWHEETEELLYIGHENAIKPELTVEENVLFWCQLRGEAELGGVALHYFGLQPYADLPCGELSAGWQRKVALTRLITVPSAIWLLDEPMTHLDAQGEAQVAALIDSKCSNGGIVLMATHQDIQKNSRSKNQLYISDYRHTSNEKDAL